MSLERLNIALDGVAMVDVSWHKLVGAVPVILDDASVFCTGFVVKHLGGDGMSERFETSHDGVVGSNAVFVLASPEDGLEDGVGVAVVGDHDVLITTAGSDGEQASLIGVELFDGLHTDVDFA